MVAMRSASEQQLIHDCLSYVDASVRRDDRNSPSVERLMTLLWTLRVIERERAHKTTGLDAATGVGQACEKLDMFRPDERAVDNVILYPSGPVRGGIGKKSLIDWRMAFPKSS